MLILLAYVGVGLVTGLLAGMFGMGGGVIIVPAIIWLLIYSGAHVNTAMHTAIGCSLAVMVFTTLGSIWSHYNAGHLQGRTYLRLMPGAVLGVIFGAIISNILDTHVLQILFGCFLWLIALRVAFLRVTTNESHLPNRFKLNLISGSIGFVSGLLGIGGGAFMTPILASYDVSLPEAAGISSINSFVTGIVGTVIWQIYQTVSFAKLDPSMLSTPWSIVFLIGIPGMLAAPLGVKIAYRLPVVYLKYSFAFLLIAIGVDLISRSF